MKKLLSILFLVSSIGFAYANPTYSYDVRLSDTTAVDTAAPTSTDYSDGSSWLSSDYGSFNPHWYVEPYVGFGFIFGGIKDNDAQLLYGESYNVDFGYKWRYQATKRWAVIINTDFVYNHYEIEDGVKNGIFDLKADLGDDLVMNREYYRSWAFGLGLGARFNFDDRSNSDYSGRKQYRKPGKYIELMAYGNYNYSRFYDLQFYGDSNLDMELRYNDDSLFYPFDAGVQATLGWNWFSVWTRYRLTDCFYSKYSDAKLPPFSAGVALTFTYKKW